MQNIEYFYSAHSAFAWLGSARLSEICAQHGARLLHKPIELSPVIEAAGGLSFAVRTQAHVDYFFGCDIEHWAEYRGVAVIHHRPTHHDAPLIAVCGLDADAILSAARGAPVQAIHRANTEEAIARDVFGSPTYVVAGDPFYGQDRLDLVDRALSRPFACSTWRNPAVG